MREKVTNMTTFNSLSAMTLEEISTMSHEDRVKALSMVFAEVYLSGCDDTSNKFLTQIPYEISMDQH